MFIYNEKDKKVSSGDNGNKKGFKKANKGNGVLSSPRILTGLSHEVRTYMNSIVAFSFLLNNDTCTESERKEYNSHILNSCEQLITLFDNFLDSAIIESEVPEPTLTRFNIDTLLEDLTIELNGALRRFEKENISVVLDEQAESLSTPIDEEKVIRVIKNLFFNALHNTDSGYIKIGYKPKGSRVIFYVMDSGTGYHNNKDLLLSDNLTDYLKVHNNTFTTVGLILARQLVNNMGGELWVEPNGVNGTGMYFSVPVDELARKTVSKKSTVNSRNAV